MCTAQCGSMEAKALSFVLRAADDEHYKSSTRRVFTYVVGGRVGMNDTCYFTLDMKKLDPTPPHPTHPTIRCPSPPVGLYVCRPKVRYHPTPPTPPPPVGVWVQVIRWPWCQVILMGPSDPVVMVPSDPNGAK